jgi:SAM-dependent methyltransferase
LAELEARRVNEYFARRGTVAAWWAPEEGPLAFHYDAELRVIDDHLAIEAAWEVLDVGTGRGRAGLHFAAHGCRVVGIDVNPDMIELARDSVGRTGLADRFEVRAGDAAELGEFGNECFDVVLCMELFDHLPDLDRALGEMGRVLRPGGHLVFSYVPSESLYGALGNAFRAARRRLRRDDLVISRTYSLAQIRAHLTAGGFALECYCGIGLLCLNAQTRRFSGRRMASALNALARIEASWWAYYASPCLARHSAHVVGFATRGRDTGCA